MTEKIAIVGGSSGIGEALVKFHIENSLPVIVFTHDPDRVRQNTEANQTLVEVVPLDLQQPLQIEPSLKNALSGESKITRAYIVSGIGDLEENLAPTQISDTLSINCDGLAKAAYIFANYFIQKGSGHLIGITSVASLRGSSAAPLYNASKAYQRILLEGLRCRMRQKHPSVSVTEIRPGFVDTAMMKADKPFWVVSPEKAASQIINIVEAKKEVAYVSRRWRLIGMLLQSLPRWLYSRIG
ncbi:SDR family NAD(P)-dependent oxidoreductase [Puniceicoccaceae bacterium K14]|nr:SDR family NAD(P)-dependent oxidoreductase [Puniceicoccaceae bacterium K14]